jgi:hypothetical protein
LSLCVLFAEQGVKVVYRTKELEEQQARRSEFFPRHALRLFFNVHSDIYIFRLHLTCSRIWNETWLAGFFYKPCNYELFVKQSLNMEMAIVMARVCLFLAYHIYKKCD